MRTSTAAAQVPPEPQPDFDERALGTLIATVEERKGEEQQSSNRHAGAQALALGQPAVAQSRRGDCEDPDPPCCDALHERQGRQRQGSHVQHKSAGLHSEGRQPRATPKQQAQRGQWTSQRQRWKVTDRVVLAQVGQADQGRRGERQHERNDRLGVGSWGHG
jgi:hypothetical protein